MAPYVSPADFIALFITVEEFERLIHEAEAEVLEAEREVEKDGAAARPEPAGSGQPGSEGRSASRPNGKSMRESP